MSRYASGTIMKRGQALTGKASGVESGNITGPSIEVGDSGTVYAEVIVTVAGTTLLVVIEGSNDNSNWITIGQIGNNGYSVGSLGTVPTNIAGTGTFRGFFPAPQFVRYRSVVTGSFTYSINLEAGAPF